MQFYTPTDIINIPTDIVDPKSKGKEIFLTIEFSIKNKTGNAKAALSKSSAALNINYDSLFKSHLSKGQSIFFLLLSIIFALVNAQYVTNFAFGDKNGTIRGHLIHESGNGIFILIIIIYLAIYLLNTYVMICVSLEENLLVINDLTLH